MQTSVARPGVSVGLTYTLLVVGLVLASMLVASLPGRASGTPVPDGGIFDTMIPPTDEGRTQFGEIFVGEVVAVTGKDEIPTSDPEDDLPVIIYDVDVIRTLKGQAADRVQVWYEGFDFKGPDYKSVGELQAGQRYLFFAGFDPDRGWYPVNAGLGVLPIKDDATEADLVATYEPLIRQQERNVEQVLAPNPCENAGQPTVAIDQKRGRSGDEITVSAENLAPPEVSLWWDGNDRRLATGTVKGDCSMTAQVTIPKARLHTRLRPLVLRQRLCLMLRVFRFP
jgi:hypothetical protein